MSKKIGLGMVDLQNKELLDKELRGPYWGKHQDAALQEQGNGMLFVSALDY